MKKNKLIPYEIKITSNSFYIDNYQKIEQINDKQIILKTSTNQISLLGNNFRINKLCDNELLAIGEINKLEIK